MSADSVVQTLLSPQSLNRFAYALNNPLRFTDPTGLFTEEELAKYNVPQDVIEDWKENDPAWWAIIKEAKEMDLVDARASGGGSVSALFTVLRRAGDPPDWGTLVIVGQGTKGLEIPQDFAARVSLERQPV